MTTGKSQSSGPSSGNGCSFYSEEQKTGEGEYGSLRARVFIECSRCSVSVSRLIGRSILRYDFDQPYNVVIELLQVFGGNPILLMN
jgi:hypothetical protein